jgi:hypothetical protein
VETTGDYKEAKRLATLEANEAAEKQFIELQDQLFRIKNYRIDGCCCISKGRLVYRIMTYNSLFANPQLDDDTGVRQLLAESLDLITDDRVRVFCVAAQVVDAEQKSKTSEDSHFVLSQSSKENGLVIMTSPHIFNKPLNI